MTQPRSLQFLPLAKIFWLIAVLALGSILLLLPRSPLPWLDEILYASAAAVVVQGGRQYPPSWRPSRIPFASIFLWSNDSLFRFIGHETLGIVSHELATLRIHGRGGAVFSAAMGVPIAWIAPE